MVGRRLGLWYPRPILKVQTVCSNYSGLYHKGYWQLNNEQILVIGFCHEPTSIMECHNYFDHCSSGWWFQAFFLNFHPELWGFMLQFWRLRIFCKWVETQPPTVVTSPQFWTPHFDDRMKSSGCAIRRFWRTGNGGILAPQLRVSSGSIFRCTFLWVWDPFPAKKWQMSRF